MELDLCNQIPDKKYDLVLAHLLLGEAEKFQNSYKNLLQNLLKIQSDYFIVYDILEDPSIDYNYLEDLLERNHFAFLEKIIFPKEKVDNYPNFIAENYVAYLLKKPNLTNLIFEYNNERISTKELIDDLEKMNLSHFSLKQKNSLVVMINQIKKIFLKKDNPKKIRNLLMKQELCLEIKKSVPLKEMFFMVTTYLSSKYIDPIKQQEFDEIVEIGIALDKRERLWRLSTNYEKFDLNFDKIANYFITVKDDYYLGEFISVLEEKIDKKKIINQIIKTQDEIFINKMIEYEFGIFDDLEISYLKDSIKNKK